MCDELGCYVWQYTRKYNSDLKVYSCFNAVVRLKQLDILRNCCKVMPT